jgi:hypothetical protein
MFLAFRRKNSSNAGQRWNGSALVFKKQENAHALQW